MVESSGVFDGQQIRLITHRPIWDESTATRISEREIQIFCTGCDYLGEDNLCRFNTPNDQARYVVIGSCGGANFGGVRGWLFRDGFQPFDTAFTI